VANREHEINALLGGAWHPLGKGDLDDLHGEAPHLRDGHIGLCDT
jgi:hypothetical protein